MMRETTSSRELAARLVQYLSSTLSCDAVGLRLSEGEDFPYAAYEGLGEAFLVQESRLCKLDGVGRPVRDELGEAVLECVCGAVIRGKADPRLPFFTARGSFWSNDLAVLVRDTDPELLPADRRGVCFSAGYLSSILVALRADRRTIGLIQLADRHTGKFSPGIVALVEWLADLVAVLLHHRLTREALNVSEERFRKIVERSTDGIVLINDCAEVVEWNPGQERITGISREEALGQPLWDLQFKVGLPEEQAAPDAYEALRASILAFVRSGEASWLSVPHEREIQRPDGGRRMVATSLFVIDTEHGWMAGSTMRDVTSLKEAERELRKSREGLQRLSRRLQEAAEQERARIAREIHDELGQSLTALHLDLKWLGSRLPTHGPGLDERVREMGEVVEGMLRSVRRLATELRPWMLDHLGIGAAIEWLAEEFERRSRVTCHLQMATGEERRDPVLETAVFRVVQEALTNVARHAEAENVRIQLTINGGALRVEVMDDGVGIDEAAATAPDSLGLIGMRERVEQLGGWLSIRGVAGQGTKLVCVIPKSGEDSPR
jgi:PAS domain S-box-containing protein